MSIDTAIIMAAGLGSRIPEFSRNAPKGFISVGGQPIVERSVALLADCGIRRIIIGTGYLAAEYEALARRIRNVQIECVHNADYANSGSLETFLLCAGNLDRDFLSLESDLLYDVRILHRALDCPFSNVIMTSGRTGSGDEVHVETDDRSKLVNLSKDRSVLARADGELVGICKLQGSIPDALAAWMSRDGQQRPAQMHYEEGLARIAATVPLHVEKADLPWTEIDTPEHLARASNLIWPRIASFAGEQHVSAS